MATPDDKIPLRHLPLDVLRQLIAQRMATGDQQLPAITEPASEVDELLGQLGLRTVSPPGGDLEPLRAELARRLNDGREVARQRAALYRSHRTTGLLEYRARLTRTGLDRFIMEAGERLFDEAGAPPMYLLVPPNIFHRHLIGIYNIFGAALAGQPLVLTTPFGALKIVESSLVERITLA